MKLDIYKELPINKQYFNRPQQLVELTQAHITIMLWGRGTGKTTAGLALRSYELIHKMPGSLGWILGETYQQLLLITLKELILGWEKLGMKEGVHYIVGKQPPKYFAKPLRKPLKAEYSIFFYNGTVIQLLSQDVFNNGSTSQFGIADEARKLNKGKLDQLLLTLRGEEHIWGKIPELHSITFATDQPVSPSEMWIFDYEKEMDVEQIELIQYHQLKLNELILGWNSVNPSLRKKYSGTINSYVSKLNKLRSDSVYFSEASSLDNIYALGEKAIDNFKRILPDLTFRVSVLNERMKKPENAFYPNFNSELHTYNAFTYNYLRGDSVAEHIVSVKQNCLQDGELIKADGFDLAIDSGGSINCLVVGQNHGNIYRILNAIHVKPPKKVADLANDFADYYEPHPEKFVNFYYDQTHIGTTATSTLNAAEEFIQQLRSRGWIVNAVYTGAVPAPMSRYLFYQSLLSENDERLPRLRIHKTHCDNLVKGIVSTELKANGKTGYEKEKKYERYSNVPQEQITHFTDAMDVLLYSLFKTILNRSGFNASVSA